MLKRSACNQRGAALAEFQIVVLLGALPLLLGALQAFLLLMASHTVQFATFMAAHAGAVNGADPAAMKRAFVIGLLPLHASADTEPTASSAAALVTAAYGRSLAASLVFAEIELVAPSAAAFEDFAVAGADGRVIRNDGLEVRSVAPGPRSGLSVQEANLLRIRGHYCQPLVVPFAAEVLLAALRWMDASPWAQTCYAANRVPLTGDVTVNMQSDARFHGP